MGIAKWARDRGINGKASTGSCGRNRIYRLTHRGGGAAPATARLVFGSLRILCSMYDVKIEKSMCLDKVGALVYWRRFGQRNKLKWVLIICHLLSKRPPELTDVKKL